MSRLSAILIAIALAGCNEEPRVRSEADLAKESAVAVAFSPPPPTCERKGQVLGEHQYLRPSESISDMTQSATRKMQSQAAKIGANYVHAVPVQLIAEDKGALMQGIAYACSSTGIAAAR
jgi:hypothetical protein